jgi:hypothetical protein
MYLQHGECKKFLIFAETPFHMKKITSHALLVIGLCVMLADGCTSDELPEPNNMVDCTDDQSTYVTNIRNIIDNSCAYSGCHLDSAPGNYSNYEGVRLAIESGSFEQRVFTIKADPVLGMPPNNAPAGRPADLTEDELNTLRCWIENGYPEN